MQVGRSWVVGFVLVAVLTAGPGCSGDDPVAGMPDSLSGIFEGGTTVGNVAYTFNLTLQQEGPEITGTGEYVTAEAAVTFTISGTYTTPTLVLDFQPPDRTMIRFTGEAFRDLSGFSGELRGGELDGVSLEFVREP